MRILYLAQHLSTGGMPAFLLKRIQTLLEYTDVDVYVVEFKNYSNEYNVQKKEINKITPIITLGEDKMLLIDMIKDLKIDVVHIDEMIEVLRAAKRGEDIQWLTPDDLWVPWRTQQFNFVAYQYRIAPKPQMTLVEELRSYCNNPDRPLMMALFNRAADRIEELEKAFQITVKDFTTDELLAELKRRTSC
jgi:hypothetical protein